MLLTLRSEHVIIPRTENTIKCTIPNTSSPSSCADMDMIYVDINSELDELDREEFYRLKKAGFLVDIDSHCSDS
jgi:hypothetical protein